MAKEIYRLLPHESTVYLGDTARVPYGNRSPETVIQFVQESVEALLKYDVKTIVIACGTASSVALDHLQQKCTNLPILGVIDPAAKTAAELTKSNHVGVIGTNATIASNSFGKAVLNHNPSVVIHNQSCPLFVPLVEEGITDHHLILAETVKYYLANLKSAPIDTLILGCTHYPIISEAISSYLPQAVLVNAGVSVAKNLQQLLTQRQLSNSTAATATHKYLVTDKNPAFEKTAQTFLGRPIHVEKISL